VTYTVAIVVDPDARGYVVELAARFHVWARGTKANLRVAQDCWSSNPDHSLERGITTFDSDVSQQPEEALISILPTVDEHHGEHSHDPPWDSIEVFGTTATAKVRATLSEYGVTEFFVTPTGFVCRRSV
jgi:hypothetical protein